MRLARVAVLCGLAVAAGSCAREPEAPATPAVLNPQIQGTLNQVMRGILFPNSNIIFDAQDTDPAAPPDANVATTSPYAGTYGGWEAVENASVALGEAANLISLPGRTCQNGKPIPLNDELYQKGIQGLRDIAQASYMAAQAKNMDAMLDIADRLTTACATCHDVYRDRIVDGRPIGMEDRCTS
jgi:hypothetical protein